MGTLLHDLEIVVHECRRQNLRPDITRIKLKEKLQLYVLNFIYNHPQFHHLIFYGGTCLRICHQLNRMSEDIDFETTQPFDKNKFANQIKDHFQKHLMFAAISTHVPGKNIERVELRFPILYKLGLSTHEKENLIVKVEVNPIQESYPTEFMTLAKDRFSFVIRHYDLPTLMAGKILACLERVWEKKGIKVKGRDYYDLIWYMQKGILPNANRLAQAKQAYGIQEAFLALNTKIEKIKPSDLLADLRPLFENAEFPKKWVAIFKKEFQSLYKHYQTKICF